jgi:heme/copper-type cytochrome/quinol oxidase subunit 2
MIMRSLFSVFLFSVSLLSVSLLCGSLMASATLLLTIHGPIAHLANSLPGAPEGVQVIEVTAKKYQFNPSPIRVRQGTKVQLKITATDHAHGFPIDPSPEGADAKAGPGLVFASPLACKKIEKGQTATVEFVAQTAGAYSFRCCTHCGWDHRGMKGQLVVEP